MKNIISILFAVTLGVACNNAKHDPVDAAQTANEEKDSANAVNSADENDAKFMVEAASGGMMEVALGEAAQNKSQNAQVRSFGMMMVQDHSKANQELKQLAAAKNITVPASMGEDHQKMADKMMEKSGAEFDKDYMSMMVDDHKEDISKFEKISTDGKDADIKAFAAKTLPVLKTHLDSAIVVYDVAKKEK